MAFELGETGVHQNGGHARLELSILSFDHYVLFSDPGIPVDQDAEKDAQDRDGDTCGAEEAVGARAALPLP